MKQRIYAQVKTREGEVVARHELPSLVAARKYEKRAARQGYYSIRTFHADKKLSTFDKRTRRTS